MNYAHFLHLVWQSARLRLPLIHIKSTFDRIRIGDISSNDCCSVHTAAINRYLKIFFCSDRQILVLRPNTHSILEFKERVRVLELLLSLTMKLIR